MCQYDSKHYVQMLLPSIQISRSTFFFSPYIQGPLRKIFCFRERHRYCVEVELCLETAWYRICWACRHLASKDLKEKSLKLMQSYLQKVMSAVEEALQPQFVLVCRHFLIEFVVVCIQSLF